MDDVDRIMAVMEAAFDPHWGEAWNRRQLTDSLLLPHTHYLLASASDSEAHGKADIGGFALTRSAPGEEELLLIAVHPDARGRGIGSRLLQQCKEDARSRGASRLFLEMRESNSAESLYRTHGFEPIGRRRGYYRCSDGHRLDALTFACEL